MVAPNWKLRAAREATRSRVVAGEHMSRAELAEEVNTYHVAIPTGGAPILLDLEHVSIGHPDWDLIQLAVDYTDFARIDEQDYRSFVHAYGGYDVTATPGFRVLADIQELRWTKFVIRKSASNEAAGREGRHRIACLRGEVPRPWTWAAF